MTLGERLRQARLDAGLSQRQLCGGEITRNMLSQIENGSAKPSMGTLRYLAARLGKPISYFLEEQTVTSPNQACMAAARHAYAAGDGEGALEALADYRTPDPVFDQEYLLLLSLSRMDIAQKAIADSRFPYAQTLLDQAGEGKSIYYSAALERRRLLLLSQAQPGRLAAIAAALPVDDRELLLRAGAALETGDAARCAEILDAAEDKLSPNWNFLRAEVYLALKEYAHAASCYHKAEAAYPKQTAPRLEKCYRELEDFKMAYEYACKQR